MKISKMLWFNVFAAAACLFCGIYCIYCSKILYGILAIIFAILNIYCVLDYIAEWWEDSDEIQKKFKFTCKNCGYSFVPSFWLWFFVPHISSRRYLKCESCGNKHFMRRK